MPDPWLADRRQPRDSLATKIIFFVFLSTFVTSLVVSWVSVRSTYSFLRAHLEESYPATLWRARESLVRVRHGALQRLEQLAREPVVARVLAGEPGADAEARRLLAEQAERTPHLLEALAIRDERGALRAATDAAAASSPRSEPETGGALRVVEDRLLASLPLHDPGGRVRGVLEATLPPPETAFGHPEPGPTVYLVDRSGRVLTRAPASDAQAFADFPPALLDPRSDAPLLEFRAGDGRRGIASLRELEPGGWLLVAAEPVERAFAPVFSVITRIFVIDLAVILLFSFLAYEITSAIVRPLEELSDAARRISQGELEVEIGDQRRRDEIGLLTRTFNDMARRLRRNRSEIEQQHRQLREQNEQLQQANEVLEQLSITDGLTKLHNHRYFQEALTREIKRVSRTGEALAMLLIDIDDFKALNDRLGHAAGDAVLVRIARILNEAVRESDVLARYGGEEFVVLATGTDLEGAAFVAEKVRTAVAESTFGIDPSGEPMRITVSVGVARYEGDRRGFFDTADRALYRAKAAGKNCVVSAADL